MAITYLKSVQNSGVGTSLALAIPSGGPVAGDLLVLGLRLMAGVSIVSIVDTLLHDWTVGIAENPQTVGADHVDYLFYIGKCLGGADTVTITTSSSALICACLGEYTGYGPSGAMLDGHNGGSSTGTVVDSNTANTVDVFANAVAFSSTVTGVLLSTDGTPNNWSNRETAANKLQLFDQSFTSPQTGVKLHGTITSDTWGALIATFKAAPGAAPSVFIYADLATASPQRRTRVFVRYAEPMARAPLALAPTESALPWRAPRPSLLRSRIFDDAVDVPGSVAADDVVPTQFSVFGPPWPAHVPDAWMGQPPIIGRPDVVTPPVRVRAVIPPPIPPEMMGMMQLFSVGDDAAPQQFAIFGPPWAVYPADAWLGQSLAVPPMDSAYTLMPTFVRRLPVRVWDDAGRVTAPPLSPSEAPYLTFRIGPANYRALFWRNPWDLQPLLRPQFIRYITSVGVAPFKQTVGLAPSAYTVLIVRS